MICDNVETIRKAKGVTKTFLAQRLGLSLQGYRYAFSSEERLDVRRLHVVSEILNVPVEIFFDDKLTQSVIEKTLSIPKAV